MNRTLLRNATLIDGTGTAARTGDLLICGDRIAEIGAFAPPADAAVLDCSRLTVAPGFIDGHAHSDLQAIEGRREKIRQGVTTEVVGNCGFSAFPAPPDAALLREFANGILCGGDGWGWPGAADYLREARAHAAVNVHSLVGHGALRIAHAGNRGGPVEPRQLERMDDSLREALEQGACGLSTGLMYHPGSSAPPEELERLCRTVASMGRIYATHMRNYSEDLLPAVEEQLALARRCGCRLQISHLQAVGAKNWGLQQPALELIERARAADLDVGFDCYPYVAGSTVLTQFLPQWALEGGLERMLARFRNPVERRRVIDGMRAMMAHPWTDLYVSSVGPESSQELVGRSLAEISGRRRQDPAEVVLDLLTEERGSVNILEFNQSEPNLRQLLTHPLSNTVSDGFYVKGRPHPRLCGAFPALLGEFCRERKWMPLTEAIRKITDLPARRFGIAQRGRLERGYYADVVVFDADRIGSPATYQDPWAEPAGIRQVFRNGSLTHPQPQVC